MIQVRLAQMSDAAEIKRLNDLFNGEGSNTVETIEKSLEANHGEIVCVALESENNANKFIGFCCGQIVNSVCYSFPYGDITEFFITEECRRQDAGKKLIKFIESEFDKRGVNHLHHLTGGNNTTVLTLFHSLGYRDSTESSYKSSSMVILEKDIVIN
jgi:ribosomal protein S18 acetylase RimI-like enzyme